MEHVDVGGLRVAYRRRGDGVPLVLLHGAVSDGRVWRVELERFSDGFDVFASPALAITEDPELEAMALAAAKPQLALYVGGMGARGKNFYNDLFCDYGFEKEAKEIQDLYLDGKKQEAEALVPTEFLEAMNLVGPESYVKERIAAYRESGVTNLQITPAVEDAPALVRRMKELVAS